MSRVEKVRVYLGLFIHEICSKKTTLLVYLALLFYLAPESTHYVSINTVLKVSKSAHFLNLPTLSFCLRNVGMVPIYKS